MIEEIRKAVDGYADNSPLRALIQLIPTLGGPLDTLFASRGSQIQQERIKYFIEELEKSIAELDKAAVHYSDFASEEGSDLLMQAVRGVIKNRSKERIRAFARIVANRALGQGEWSEAEEATRLLDDLSELDLLVLLKIAPMGVTDRKKQLSGFTVRPFVGFGDDTPIYTTPLQDIFPDHAVEVIKASCVRLLNLGLLKDEGIGKYDTPDRNFFSPTELTIWLLNWIEQQGSEEISSMEGDLV